MLPEFRYQKEKVLINLQKSLLFSASALMDNTDVKNNLIVVENAELRYRLREEAKKLISLKKNISSG